MNEELILILRILGLLLSAAGIFVVFAAPRYVDRHGLADKKQVDPKMIDYLSPEEQQKYKRDSAVMDVKLRGLIFAAPGFILILIAFR